MPDPTAGQPPVEDDADDIGAALEQAWDAQEGEPETTDSPAAGTEPASSPVGSSSASSPAEAGVDAGRARGPDGKFVKAPAQAEAQPAEFKIPERWPDEVKQELAAIHAANPQHAQFLLKQYDFMRNQAAAAFNRAQQEGQAHLKTYNDLLAPGRQARALQGVDDSTYVRNLIAAGEVLDKNPAQGLKWLAQKYGVDLQQLANPQAGGQPEIPAWAQRVQEEQNAIKQFIASQAQGQEVARVHQASDWINTFASQKDATGQALYPHFDDVLDEIIVNVRYQMDTGRPVDVKAAYDRAVRMNDSVWLKEQTARSEATRKEAEARKKRDLEDAKRAGYSVSGSGADMREGVPDSLEEHLNRNYERFVRS